MPERTYELIALVGVSDSGASTAIRSALRRADQTLQALDWFAVQQLRGTIRDGEVGQFQVTLKVGFRLLRPEERGR